MLLLSFLPCTEIACARSFTGGAAEAAGVPIGRTEDFKPDINPADIRFVSVVATFDQAFKEFNIVGDINAFNLDPILPLYRKLSKPSWEAFKIRSGIDECRGCPSYINYYIAIGLPEPETYRVTLTVVAGSKTGTWSVSRRFDQLHPYSGHPRAGQLSKVRNSISEDLDLFGREACQDIVGSICPSGKPQ
ncbi:MAG: hypothetical protein IT548_19630 [Alphaproteobacteria bacterium]|nr:hypothetical protein [Alphaproteobacteria bacterium]